MDGEKGVSLSTLKTIAIVCMLADHTGAIFLSGFEGQQSFPGIIYVLLRIAGRVTFPIMLFALIEGVLHTRNEIKYLIRFSEFAVISEIPYDLAFSNTIWNPQGQNVMFTLTICLSVILLIRRIYGSEKPSGQLKFILSGVVTAAGGAAAYFLNCDYGAPAVAAVVLMYVFRRNRLEEYSAGSAVLMLMDDWFEIFAFLGLPLVYLYNGKKGQGWKYLFYIFYPGHLMVLWLIKIVIFKG